MPALWIAGGSALLGAYNASQNRSAQQDSADQSFEAMMAQIASNENISAENLAAVMERFNVSMDWAKELRGQELKGSTNAYLDTNYFDDRYGWMTDLSKDSQGVADAAQRQELLNRTELDSNNRERENRLADFQRTEQLTAEDLGREYRRLDNVSGDELSNLTYLAGAQGRNEALDKINESQMMTLNRTGNSSSAGDIMAKQSSQAAKDSQGQKISSMLAGLTGANALNAQNRNGITNERNNYRDKSTQAWSPQFNPTSLGSFSSGDTRGSTSAMNAALGQSVGQQDYVQANYADALRTQAYGNANSDFNNSLMKAGTALGNVDWGSIFNKGGGSDPYGGNRQDSYDFEGEFNAF